MSDFEQTGDGAVYTTIEDLFLWDRNFYEPRVGTAAILAQMQTPGTLQNGKTISYGLGLAMGDLRGLKTVSHGGSWAGYRAELLRFPEEKLSVACLCNLGRTNPSDLARRVAAIYLGSRMTPEATPASLDFVSLEESVLQARAGTYWDRASSDYLFVSVKDGNLEVEEGGWTDKFRPVSAIRFATESKPAVEIVFEGESVIFRRGEDTQNYSRIEPWKPAPSELEKFRGRYRSEEILGAIEVDVEGNALVLRHRTLSPDAMKPTGRDSFTGNGLNLSFTRDSGGEIDGFTLDMGRVKGIVYTRERS